MLYPALTVIDLLNACKEQVAKGNADKKILITSDDEGNEYHGLFYLFIDDKKMIEECKGLFCDSGLDTNELVLLG